MIKTLSKSIKEYKKPSLLAVIFGCLEVVCEVFVPVLMAKIIDNGIEVSDKKYVIQAGILLLIASLAAMAAGSLAGVNTARASVGFSSNLRKDMFYRIQNFSFFNIDKFSTSSIVTRLTTDVTNVQMAFFMIIRIGMRALSMIVFAFIMAVSINAKLARIYAVVAPLLGLALFLMIKYVYPIFSRVFELYDKLNQTVQENLRGIRVVKSFVREKYEEEKFDKISSEVNKNFVMAEKVAALNIPLLMLAIYATILLLAWFGAYYIYEGSMTTGELFSMISFTMQIMINLMMFAMVLVMITIARNSGERIAEILDEKSSLTNCSNPIYKVPDGSIEFDDVGFSYSGDPKKLCLIDISLKIESGETIGIIGATGSSKSTLVQLIPRLYDATIGRVLVGGINVKDYDMHSLRDQVAVVLQKNVLFSGTIKENLRWGNKDATDEELVHACKLAQADNFISELPDGYNSRVEQGGKNFSGGQQQRLCIARALLKNPKILILDDSTSAVDTRTDMLIRKAMYEEIPETTKIIIAQRISSVEHANRIVIMDNGRIADIGSHNELLKRNEHYRGLYDSQVRGGGDIEG